MRLFVGLALLTACSSSHSPGVVAGSSDAAVGGADGSVSLPVDAARADTAVQPDAFVDRGVEEDYDDMAATLAGAMRTQELQAMVDGVNAAYGGGTLPGFTSPQPGELTGQRGSVTYDYMIHCEDQTATDNFTCGPASNHIHWMATIDGPVMIDALSFSEFKLTTKWTIYEIYLNKPQVTGYDHMLLAGGVTYTITAKRTRATANPSVRSYTASAAVTYTGPGAATLVLDGTHTYNIDMGTGSVS